MILADLSEVCFTANLDLARIQSNYKIKFWLVVSKNFKGSDFILKHIEVHKRVTMENSFQVKWMKLDL